MTARGLAAGGWTARAWRGASPYVAAVTFAVLLWTMLGWWSEQAWTTSLLPTPWEVATAFVDAVTSVEFYRHLLATLRRVVIVWVLAVSIGVGAGFVMGRVRILGALLAPWTIVGYAVPAAATVLFMVLLFGVNDRSAMASLVVSVSPFLINIIYQAARSTDARLLQMADVYVLNTRSRLGNVLVPQLLPAILTVTRFGFAITWKLVFIVEVFAASDGIGQQLEFFYHRLRPDKLLAWTLSFMLVMIILERFGYTRLERRLFRWRQAMPGEVDPRRVVAA